MRNRCHLSSSPQLPNTFCLFSLAEKVIEDNWVVGHFILVDAGLLYGLYNKPTSTFDKGSGTLFKEQRDLGL